MEAEFSRSFKLFREMDRTRRAWQSIVPCEEVSKSEFSTLLVIAHGGKPFHDGCPKRNTRGITLSALATVMGQSLPAVSQRIAGLESSGYVCRQTDAADRRVCNVQLTPEGDALLRKAYAQFNATLERAISCMTPEEADMLTQLLHRVADELNQIAKEGE